MPITAQQRLAKVPQKNEGLIDDNFIRLAPELN